MNVRKSTSIPLKKTDLRISVSARRSTDTHAENTTRYLLETTFTSPTVMVPTEATIRPDFPECQLIATDFAYQNDLCAGALGPESYLDLGRSRYTCLNRCGEPPEYGKGFFQCGCDVNCEAHKDCCRDMAQVCPELHNKGNNNIPKNIYNCYDFAIVYSQGDEPAPYSTESYASYTPSIINTKQVLPFKPRTLIEFSKSLRWFKTIDPKTRLIFNELFGHNAYKSSNATPYFIPIVTGLSCTPEVAEYPVSPNALLLLPWCRVEYVRDVITNYHRPCRRYQTLTCRCNDDSLLTDHAHNACLGDKFSQNNLYRHQLWDVHLKSLELEVPESESDCLIREVNFFGGIIPRTGVTKHEDITVKMRVSPVMSRFQTPSHTSEDKLTHGGARKDDDGILKSVSDINFIVDLSNTPERRFSCPSIHSRLEDCRLEECAEGGLILTGQLSHEIPVRRYCIVPVGAKVLLGDGSRAVPSCTCVRIMAVLGDLKLWSTRLQWSQTQCLIILTAFPKSRFSTFIFFSFLFFLVQVAPLWWEGGGTKVISITETQICSYFSYTLFALSCVKLSTTCNISFYSLESTQSCIQCTTQYSESSLSRLNYL